MMDRFNTLLQRYSDGEATPEEVAELQRTMRTNAKVRAAFLDFVNLDESLAAVASAKEVALEPRRVSFVTWISWLLAKSRKDWRPILAMSLGIILLGLATNHWSEGRTWATIVSSQSGVVIGATSGNRPATGGERLGRNEWIEVSRDGMAEARVPGLGVVLLGPEARLNWGGKARRLNLARGFIEILAEKQRPGYPWLIRTEEAEASVLGTKFSLASANGRTAMRVEEGLVHLTALENGQAEDVAGGNRAFVTGDQAPTVSRTRAGSVLLLTSRHPDGTNWNRFNQLIGDKFLSSRLWQLGFRVETKHYDTVLPEDIRDRALIIVSLFAYGVGEPALERIQLGTAAVPVLCLEPAGYSVLGMTGGVMGVDHGFRNGASPVDILNPYHPLAAGLRGTSTTWLQEVISWGVPSASATVVAHLPGRPDQAVLFAYEVGAKLVRPSAGPTETQPTLAPSRRVGLFLDPYAIHDGEGEIGRLFEAAVDWSVTTNTKP